MMIVRPGCSKSRIGGQAPYPLVQAWGDCHRRWRYTTRENENDSGTSSSTTSEPNVFSTCQMNYHPDFLLRRKKEEMTGHMATMSSLKQQQVGQWQMPADTVRSNDGTSSGALAADRLRVARRKAIETNKSHLLEIQQQQQQQQKLRRAGRTIVPVNENPIRSNDGTSSGALVADRLRVARRIAMESAMNSQQQQLHDHQHCVMEQPGDGEFVSSVSSNTRVTTPKSKSVSSNTRVTTPKSKSVNVIENPERPNDGTSSGALVADRLRIARRKAIESMNTQALP